MNKERTHTVLYSLLMVLGLIRVLFPPAARAEEFFYKQAAGDKYRILSTVREDVYVDYVLSHKA